MSEELDIRDEYIGRVASGRRFAEFGGLWGVVSEKISVAASAGATSLTMIDILPQDDDLWSLFRRHVGEIAVETHTANLDDSRTVQQLGGRFDVVHCSGILYHCPNPLHSMTQLRKLSNEYLILTSAVVPETIDTSQGRIDLGIGGIRLVPYLSDQERKIFAAHWGDRGITGLVGLDVECTWSVDDYTPWWWLMTPSVIKQMARAVGFEVVADGPFWDGLAHTFLLRRTGPDVHA